MILIFDVFNEFALITININLFLDNNVIQFEKNGFEKDIIDLIDIKNNNYLIAAQKHTIIFILII